MRGGRREVCFCAFFLGEAQVNALNYSRQSLNLRHCEERLVGQASSLSITDDRQDAGPTSNLGSGHAEDCFVPRDAGLAMTVFSPT